MGTDDTTILVVDDHRSFADLLAASLNIVPGMRCVGTASSATEGIARAAELQPDVVVMDIEMPKQDGLQATRLVLGRTSCRVLILTTFDSDEYVYEALRSGASGFLLNDAPAEQLTAAIRCVAAGDALIDPSVTRRLIGRFTAALQPAPGVPAQLRDLTARELDVLRLIATGASNQEIARALVVEDSTVKTHVGRVLNKLGLRDRVQAVVLAYETGLIVPDRSA